MVLLIFQHVHESAVVNAVHPQGPDKVPLHHPEGFCQEEGIGDLFSDAVNYLPPKLLGNLVVKLFTGERSAGPAGDIASLSQKGVPETLDMALGEGHCRIKSYYLEVTGNVENLLNNS